MGSYIVDELRADHTRYIPMFSCSTERGISIKIFIIPSGMRMRLFLLEICEIMSARFTMFSLFREALRRNSSSTDTGPFFVVQLIADVQPDEDYE